jgi:hypothetical protein
MARMVRSNIYPSGVFKIPPMPEVNLKLRTRYHEDRLKAFPPNQSEYIEIFPNLDEPAKSMPSNDMSLHLQGDLEFSNNNEKKKPEYIHEVFQRLILNFLVTNERESFMSLEKAGNPRRVKDTGMKRTGTTRHTGSVLPTTENKPEATLNDEPEGSIVSVHRYQSNISIYACPPVANQETAPESVAVCRSGCY